MRSPLAILKYFPALLCGVLVTNAGCFPSASVTNPPMNTAASWPFDQEPNVAAITTRQVLEGQPILSVVHYEDDHSWAFMCGTTDDEADGRVVAMKTIVQQDATVKEIADLPPGWRAWRESADGRWQREVIAD